MEGDVDLVVVEAVGAVGKSLRGLGSHDDCDDGVPVRLFEPEKRIREMMGDKWNGLGYGVGEVGLLDRFVDMFGNVTCGLARNSNEL